MKDCDIINLYWERSETAIIETHKKYHRYCHYIAYKILANNSDAEEAVNDAYLKVWSTVPPQRPNSLKAYIGMITRQLSFNKYSKQHTQKRSGEICAVLDELAECIPDGNIGDDIGESIVLRDALNKFITELPDKTQKIFIRRYWYSSAVRDIARDFGMTVNNVNVLLFNTRKKLKDYLSEEGFDL